MYSIPNYVRYAHQLRSLLLTMLISFIVPVAMLGMSITGLTLSSHVPMVAAIAQETREYLLAFLNIFGSGCALQGTIVIGTTCSIAGGLFDVYNFYQGYHCQQKNYN
ncbi:MAG: hypothetical protein HC916_06495 [Coleofasciculaceae cyanobacterium SM2_1_6]|nr:hypothetical protein [Coleofasciculaceae cyanobacterium SM2_1_6]